MKDKDSILQTMKELDIKKEATIRAAYQRVNKDFGDIFSNLLTGANAKLQPPDGKSLLDGLEVKVQVPSLTSAIFFFFGQELSFCIDSLYSACKIAQKYLFFTVLYKYEGMIR